MVIFCQFIEFTFAWCWAGGWDSNGSSNGDTVMGVIRLKLNPRHPVPKWIIATLVAYSFVPINALKRSC